MSELTSDATPDFPILEVLEKRWSPTSFSPKPIEKENLNTLFEAARWSASSFNEQPWRFIVGINNNETYKKIFSVLVKGNQKTAENVPVLVLSITKIHFSLNQNPNLHAWHDMGLAMSNLIIEATHLGIFSHQMAGFDRGKAREIFHIPKNFEPTTITLLGYLDNDKEMKKVHEEKKRKRTRHSQDKFVFYEPPYLT